jgi:hypothetical protein
VGGVGVYSDEREDAIAGDCRLGTRRDVCERVAIAISDRFDNWFLGEVCRLFGICRAHLFDGVWQNIPHLRLPRRCGEDMEVRDLFTTVDGKRVQRLGDNPRRGSGQTQ